MSNFPSVRPSLNLQFDSQPTPADMTSHLASVGATFSRASIGTYTDANGLIAEASAGQARPNYSTAGVHEGLLIEESRTNNIVSSENFISPFTINSVTVYKHQIISPDGKANGTFIVPDTANTTHRIEEGQSSEDADVTWTATLYIKEGGYNSINIRIRGNGTGNGFGATFDLGTETATAIGNFGTGSYTSSSLQSVGNGWYRCTVTGVPATSGTGVSSDLRILNDSNVETYAGNGTSGLYLWGWQLEQGSFATSYIPTIPTFSSRASTATFFNSSGVLSTASTNVARTDHKYIGGQWVEAGLLLEGASTNLFAQSENFTTSWTLQNATLTANDTTAPDGTTTAEKLTSNSSSTYSRVEIFPSTTDNTVYTASVFFKNGNTSNGFVNIRDKGGTTRSVYFDIANIEIDIVFNSPDGYTIEQFGDWVRCSVSVDVGTGGGTARVQIGVGVDGGATSDNGDYIYIWGAQFEEQSQPTSYIPTSGSTATRSADVYTTATKTRSADVCTISGTAFTEFYNDDKGTFLVECIRDSSVDTLGVIYQAGDGTNANRTENFIDANGDLNNRYRRNNATLDPLPTPVTSFDDSVQNKIAFRYDQTSAKVFLNGQEVSSRTSLSGTPTGINELGIGRSLPSALELNGFIKRLIYFPRALQATEIQKLTQ